MSYSNNYGPADIELFWGKERFARSIVSSGEAAQLIRALRRFRIPMPPLSTTLSHLKSTIYNLTGIAPENQKLIASGAILKDDLAPLSSFGIFSPNGNASSSKGTNGDSKRSFWESWGFGKRKTVKLVLVGNNQDDLRTRRPDLEQQNQKLASTRQQEKAPEDEATVVKRIQAITQNVESDWSPAIDRYETYVTSNNTSQPSRPQTIDRNEQEQPRSSQGDRSETPSKSGTATPAANLPMNERTSAVLSESLLQQLLKLDSIEIGPGMEQARKERKDAVRLVQAALDRVDQVKKSGAGPAKEPSSSSRQ